MLKQLKNSPFIVNYRRMWPFVKPYWFRALIAMAICIPIGSFDAIIAWCLKPFMDSVLIEKSMGTSPWLISIFIVALTVVQGLLNYGSSYINTWVSGHITQDLKKTLYKKLLSFEPSFFDTRNSGDILFRFDGDANTATSGLLENLRFFATRTFSSISLLIVLVITSWQLSLIAIIVLAITFYPATRMRNLVKKIVRESVSAGSLSMTNFNETFAGNRTITAYNYQPYQKAKFSEVLNEIFSLSMKTTKRTSWLTPSMHITASIGVAVTIGYGSYLILTQQLTPGGFVAFIAALLMLYTPIKKSGNSLNKVLFSFLAIERVFEILHIKPTIANRDDAIDLKTIQNEIIFNDVSFSYVKDRPVLKHINLKAKVGQSIAFVGNSGGGKSTIVSLIPRFYDITSGCITIDGIDIRSFTLESLRNKIAVVFQDNFLFSGTIKDNILVGKEDASDSEIMQAIDNAYLTDFIQSLPDGINTFVGERGILLSGGQKQRVAIARAFIKNAPIIILDEATSALDNKSEAVVQKAIENLMKNRTVFVIAHRLSTIQNADCIVVLNQGEIAEMGTHDELMAKDNGTYRSLYQAQFKQKTVS